MKNYNYYEAVKNDVKKYVNNEINLADYSDREELEEYLNETLWINDSVTGNASGSYTFDAYIAEENLCHNMNLLKEACDEFGSNIGELVEQGAESCDVTIRCYLLSQAIAEVLDEMDIDFED